MVKPTKMDKPESLVFDGSMSMSELRAAVPAPEKDLRVKTEDVENKNDTTFDDFNLRQELLLGIYEAGYEQPSPIQEEAIPVLLSGKSLIARAKNGTGKTAAFLIPAINVCDPQDRHIQVVIMIPTRELALQTCKVAKDLSKHLNLQCMVLTGGSPIRDDVLRLSKPVHLITATPGRLLDMTNKQVANLEHLKILILDEADKLLADYFRDTIVYILDQFCSNVQLALFSATFPQTVASIQERYLHDAVAVVAMDEISLKGITQYYVNIEESRKIALLNTLFAKLHINQIIIFCNTHQRVELLAKVVTKLGHGCFYTHSKLTQQDRSTVFHEFRTGKCRCLVTSDLFTRGIDIQAVNVVINFDFPTYGETYLHRIGRSGRFGHLGLAINFVTPNDKSYFQRILSEMKGNVLPLPHDIDKSLYT